MAANQTVSYHSTQTLCWLVASSLWILLSIPKTSLHVKGNKVGLYIAKLQIYTLPLQVDWLITAFLLKFYFTPNYCCFKCWSDQTLKVKFK